MPDPDTCKSCGTPYDDHPELEDTCTELQAAKARIGILAKAVEKAIDNLDAIASKETTGYSSMADICMQIGRLRAALRDAGCEP